MAEPADIAIAIKYDKEKDQAPRVVAKGLAFPLANALYRIDLGQEVPEDLYDAVAEVLNFVYALQAEQAGADGKKPK